jgi:hypothetical protein
MTKHLLHSSHHSKLLTLLFAVCLSSFALVHAQATTSERSSFPARAPVYEVIAVKPSKPSCDVMSFRSPPGRLTIRCYQLRRLLFTAYSVKLDTTISGMPKWGDSALFDIEAETDEATTEAMKKLPETEQRNQTHLMLKALLADRFKLTVHAETRASQPSPDLSKQTCPQYPAGKSDPRTSQSQTRTPSASPQPPRKPIVRAAVRASFKSLYLERPSDQLKGQALLVGAPDTALRLQRRFRPGTTL